MGTPAPDLVQEFTTTLEKCRQIIYCLDPEILADQRPQFARQIQSLQKDLRGRRAESKEKEVAKQRKVVAADVRKELESLFADTSRLQLLRATNLRNLKRDPGALKERRIAALTMAEAFSNFELDLRRKEGGPPRPTKMDRMCQPKARNQGRFSGDLKAFLKSSIYGGTKGARDSIQLGYKLLWLLHRVRPDLTGLLFFSNGFGNLLEGELPPLKGELEASTLLNSIADTQRGWYEECMRPYKGKP
ncbi:hypothetical protein Q7P37_009728 [Cladosporium fusiforme]